jgi:hypothetical protein
MRDLGKNARDRPLSVACASSLGEGDFAVVRPDGKPAAQLSSRLEDREAE